MKQLPKTFTSKDEDIVTFCMETGEILEVIKKHQKKVSNFDKYVGIDTKHPYDCLTKDQLLETLQVMDAYVHKKVKVGTHYILESSLEKYLTLQQQSFLYHLCNSLSGWNIYIGTREELLSFGVDSKSLKRLLTSLSPYHLKVVSENTPYKGDIIIHLNPSIGWKGDTEYRENLKKWWYKV